MGMPKLMSCPHGRIRSFLFLRIRTGFLLTLLLMLSMNATAAMVQKISWKTESAYNRFTVVFDEGVKYNTVDSIKDKGFFYVDIYGLKTVYSSRLLNIDDDAALRYVHAVSYPEHGVLRLVFYLKERTGTFRITRLGDPAQLVVDTVKNQAMPMPPPPEGKPMAENQSATATLRPTATPNASTASDPGGPEFLPRIPEPKLRPPGSPPGTSKIVIIDPGHGGGNTGAQSNHQIAGKTIYEKDVVLQFAYRLKQVIDASPNMVAFISRPQDQVMPLEDRVRFAEKNLGDIFISLHLNDGAGNPNARGVEIYYLNEKGTVSGAEKALQDRENMDLGGTTSATEGTPLLKKILTDLERGRLEDWQYESYLACKHFIDSLNRMSFFRLNNRGIKNANFLVLKNFEMPAILLEIGFITNKEDLNYLVNPTFQQTTAVLIYNALNRYFAQSDPNFKPRMLNQPDSPLRP